MRRLAIIATIVMTLMVMPAGAVDARPAPSFVGRVNNPAQGKLLKVRARVRHSGRVGTFTFEGSAVAHFASGDVAVDLSNVNGRPRALGANFLVPCDQPAGPMAVDVTVTFNGVSTELALTATVRTPRRPCVPPPPPQPDL